MKKTYLLLVLIFSFSKIFSQPLFTYGNNAVGKEEFLRAYNKNKSPSGDNEKSLREYLDLYLKFKLKVKAAQELRLDTLQQLKYDMQNFRSQVEEGYMNDEKKMNELLEEAIERSKKDIHLIHFYVPLNTLTTKTDSANAFKAMNEMAEALEHGATDYVALAKKLSAKNITITSNDLGYITTFSLPYDIENLVYTLKPGGISKIFSTKKGLHVFKNEEERKDAGKWKIAQILFTIPPGAGSSDIKVIENKADSVYNLLKAGADFTGTAKQFSEDRLTAQNGGEIPEFGTGKFEISFEKKVFELEKDGDLSKPIFTVYGYHIVKRLQQHYLPADKSDEAFINTIKQQIAKDTRNNIAKENFLRNITIQVGYKRNASVKDEVLFKQADSVVANKAVGNSSINNAVICSFKKLVIKGLAWLNFVKDYKLNTDVYKSESNNELLNKFFSTSILDYYRKHLEEYNTDFKYQMQEFKEGNMLFEIMEKKVWGLASNDSAGLRKFYEIHRAQYKWDASAVILLFNCNNNKVASDAVEALKSGISWKQIIEQSEGKIQADSGRYEIAQLQLPATIKIERGIISTPLLNSGDNTSTFLKVLQIFPANQQRSFNEAKGLVINEYQNSLEQKWIDELKKKYPIQINETVFKSMLH